MSGIAPDLLLMIGVGGIFAGLGVALTVIGVATQEKRAVGRSLAALEAMKGLPSELTDELDRPFNERVVEPMLARFTSIGRRLTPGDNAQRIQHRLDVAGNPVGWTVGSDRGPQGGRVRLHADAQHRAHDGPGRACCSPWSSASGSAWPATSSRTCTSTEWANNRSERMQRELPDALDLLTISVEAGLAFDAALSRVAKSTDGPLAMEFARVLQEMNIGVGRTAAMRALGERTHIPELKSFVTAMVQADAFGIPIAQVLRIQSNEMRTKRRQRAEEKAQKVPVKILFPLIFCILPTLFLAVLGPGVISMMEAFKGAGR